ncbi:hypothetical protein [Streptomyces sp. NPDC007063]|uniref:hypothetical protein n=1 Tax=Streptomyces sp. NPDC007063 TaxID=3364772 RepID=UPI00367ED6C8
MQHLSRRSGTRWLPLGVWLLTTGAATALSWFGVHAVLDNTAYDSPGALPVSDGSTDRASPRASSTHRPEPRPSSASPTPSETPTPKKPSTPAASASRSDDGPRSPSGRPAGQVRGVTVRGGRAVFDLSGGTGALVSATPDPGWQMKVWHAPGYIRVTFTDGSSSSSVFCRWDESAPRVETFAG